jgi:hypothetical protein
MDFTNKITIRSWLKRVDLAPKLCCNPDGVTRKLKSRLYKVYSS